MTTVQAIEKRTCENCGRGLEKRQMRFCSRACKKGADYSKPKFSTCTHCGDVFEGHARYCSSVCRQASFELTYGVDRTCENCGKGLEKRQTRFCSSACYNKQKVSACKHCGKAFEGAAFYCSEECRAAGKARWDALPDTHNSGVYIIGDGDCFKIGVTTRLKSRLTALQVGSARPLHVALWLPTNTPYALEAHLHTKYKGNRLHGEWFSLTMDDVEQIAHEAALFNELCQASPL